MGIDLHAFISGGYFLTKRVSRPPFLTKLVPDPLLTLSHCFTDLAPDEWADTGYNYEDEERAAEALKFTIPAAAGILSFRGIPLLAFLMVVPIVVGIVLGEIAKFRKPKIGRDAQQPNPLQL